MSMLIADLPSHSEVTQLVTAAFGALTAALAFLAARRAKEAHRIGVIVEDSVNHRHMPDGSTKPRLYDLALENRRMISGAEFDLAQMHDKVDALQHRLAHHVDWEEQGKYEALADRFDALDRAMREAQADRESSRKSSEDNE